jgi:hypothetical protein
VRDGLAELKPEHRALLIQALKAGIPQEPAMLTAAARIAWAARW